MTTHKIVVGDAVYRLAQDPPTVDTGPSSEEMVEELRSSPSENWREYLQPIIISIRNQYGLDLGQVKLLGPRLFGKEKTTPAYGFSIGGHVKFDPAPPDQVREDHGLPPYKFKATITPEGELVSSIKIEGSEG